MSSHTALGLQLIPPRSKREAGGLWQGGCGSDQLLALRRVRLCDPRAAAYQAPPSMGFPRQEYWSRLSFPPPGDLPDPGIKPMSLVSPALAGGFFTTNTTWEALGGEWNHVYECPFNAHPKLSQQCLLISYTPIQNFFLNPH